MLAPGFSRIALMDSTAQKRTPEAGRGHIFREPALIALQNMRAHKLRSFLMLLGIILSVSTLILVVTLVSGMNGYFASRIANLGSNVFLVMKFPIISDAQEMVKAVRRNRDISWEDFEAMRDNLETPQGGRRGGTPRRDRAIRAHHQAGRQHPRRHRQHRRNGRGRARNRALHHRQRQRAPCHGRHDWGGSWPINSFPIPIRWATINVDGEEFQIVGVAKKVGNTFGQSQDNFVYVPIESWLKMYGRNQTLSVDIQARGPEWMARTREEARVLMRARRHLSPKDEDNFGILSSDALMDLWKDLTGTLASGMVGLVSIFLVIGGVVIMNVMLASVTERTREIGIRKSLGAKRRDILLQFLVESTVMALVGGAIGVTIAWLLAVVVRNTTPVPMTVSRFGGGLGHRNFLRRGRVLWGLSRAQGGPARSHRGVEV